MKQLTMTKVLTPLAALAFAFGVQAAAVSTETFDTYTAGEGATVISNQTGWSFAYGTDQADDASYVLQYSGDAPTSGKLPYGVSAGEKYLKLSTEDGTLFRHVDGDAGDPIPLNTGVFVDTDVQFTVTDPSDSPTNTVDSSDKLVIWLEATDTTTNLCVLGHQFAADGTRSDKVYTLGTSSPIVPGQWYRLTVKAISSYAASGTFSYPAFQVYLDGTQLSAGQWIAKDGEDAAFMTYSGIGNLDDCEPYIPARSDTMTELSKVGFSGEGALDSVVVTRETVVGTASELTFTWSSEAITSVSLPTVGATIASSGDTFRVEQSNTPLQIVLNGTGLANYNLTINGVAYDPESTNTIVPDGSKEIAIAATAKDTVKVTFDLTDESWDGYLEDIASVYVGDTEIPGTSRDIDLKVLTNVTVSVSFVADKAAAIELVPVDSSNISVNGMIVSVNSYAATATVKIVRRATAASVDGQQFASFDAALAYAKAAGVAKQINLAGDVTLTTAAAIGATDNITIDLAGNEITGADGYAVFTVAAGGTLTITNSTGTGYVIASAEEGSACISNSGTLNLQAGKFSGTISGGTINVTGGFYTANIANATIPDPDMKLAETVQSDTYVWTLVAKEYYTAISLDQATLALTEGDTTNLVATLTPASAADDSVTWASSDDSVATVVNGTVTAVAAGTATITLTATHDSSVTASCTVTVSAAAPSGEELAPGEQSSTVYDSEAAAKAAAANVTITPAAAVTNGMDAATAAAYVASFEAKAVAVGDGNYKVEIALTTAAETALQTQANADVATIAAGITGSGDISIAATPGFYYSLVEGTTLSNMAEGSRTLATGSTVSLTPTKSGTTGFYKVKISIADK